MAASWLALNHGTLPALVLLPAMMLLGLCGGAVWALVPAVPRAYVGLNEVISTLLLNYVALLLTHWLASGPLKAPDRMGAQTSMIVLKAMSLRPAVTRRWSMVRPTVQSGSTAMKSVCIRRPAEFSG